MLLARIHDRMARTKVKDNTKALPDGSICHARHLLWFGFRVGRLLVGHLLATRMMRLIPPVYTHPYGGANSALSAD